MAKIQRYRGDTSADEIIVTDVDGNTLDISNCIFTLTVSSHRAPADDQGQLVSIDGTITSAIAGIVEFAFSTTQADQVPGMYYYDIQMQDTNNRVTTVVKDKYEFIQDITK